MNRRIGILGALAALAPLAAPGKQKAHGKKAALAAASLCGCSLTFASYAANFTPGGEDVSVVTVSSAVTVTLPSAAANAGTQVMIVAGAPGSANRITINDDTNAFILNGPGIVVCDGSRWYVASNF